MTDDIAEVAKGLTKAERLGREWAKQATAAFRSYLQSKGGEV